MHELTHLDLFSGIGGFALAAKWAGFKTIGYSEVNEYCNAILKRDYPGAESAGDVTSAKFRRFEGVSLVTAGFPCQPWSNNGDRKGAEDDRHLWPAVPPALQQSRAAWFLGENVAGIDDMLFLDKCIDDLEAIGYEVAPPLEIPAGAVGCWHIRERVWILAHLKARNGEARHMLEACADWGSPQQSGRLHRLDLSPAGGGYACRV